MRGTGSLGKSWRWKGVEEAWNSLVRGEIMGSCCCWGDMHKVGCGGDEYHHRGGEGLSMEGLSCTLDRCRLILGT